MIAIIEKSGRKAMAEGTEPEAERTWWAISVKDAAQSGGGTKGKQGCGGIGRAGRRSPKRGGMTLSMHGRSGRSIFQLDLQLQGRGGAA
ncbi:hypothetical protein NSU_0826 [Novosphingobium pentaromativorans US6-1]|uniref:Uncharacterized protein n=1 Tax=Novosphingobium pentaromativorans US6-1 TaxID=1088721 RepID=G6E905_9SPHN|nr:hypothetical protein NSU_0826 [Novosphingobium pentaromativorans US6-1]